MGSRAAARGGRLDGLAIGLDRELRGKPAGLRTLTLVSVASALFTILTFEIFAQANAVSQGARADPIRVIEAVVTGVAFLGAGTIIQSRDKVHGMTTGASVWMVGAIGLACGTGRLDIAFLATLLTLFVLVLLGLIERRILHRREPGPHD